MDTKNYTHKYEDMTGRVDITCPYCGSLHSVTLKATIWGCECGNDFGIPLAARIPFVNKDRTFDGVMLK